MTTLSHTDFLRVIPLGGLGRIGGNLMLYETADDLIMVDCGVLFPTVLEPGVDAIIPDVSYLETRRHKLRGIVLTHGHEDHIGALPYILPQLPPVPMFATRFTASLIRHKLSEYPDIAYDLTEVADRQKITLGQFVVDPVAVTHSIPHSVALVIGTPIGNIVHTGDFKIDTDPLDGRLTDTAALRAYGDAGISVLLSDSTNSEKSGHTYSEREVEKTLHKLIAQASNRVFLTTFASHIDRLQMVLDGAAACGRRVIPVGRSMQNNMQMGLEQGFLTAARGVLAEPEDFTRLPRHKVVVIASGSQGEQNSAMTRIVNGHLSPLAIEAGDQVILSSRRIPGNERAIGNMVNTLYRLGAEVITDTMACVHSSGHGFNDEQQEMLQLCRPNFFVPLHGEYRHMCLHRDLAVKSGVARDHTFITEDGKPLEFSRIQGDLSCQRLEPITAGNIFVDGAGIGDVGHAIVRERRALSEAGIVFCTVVMVKGHTVAGPEMACRGLLDVERHLPLLQRAGDAVRKALAELSETADWPSRQEAVRMTLRRFFKRELARRPFIVPLVIDL